MSGVIRLEAWPALMTRETAAAYIDDNLRKIDELRAQKKITPVVEPATPSKRIKYRKSDLDAWIDTLREKETTAPDTA